MVEGDLAVPSVTRSCWWSILLVVMATTASLALGENPSPVSGGAAPRPHIIIILADDMGWNDVGFHGSDEIPTPNIDALAYNGLILNQHYTLPLCTPSRAAILTGKFPIRTGMQHLVILEDEPWGLGLDQKLLPQYLKEAGYKTHAIGKWHLGFHKKEYTPTFRGFDSFLGYWQGYQDYYNHSVKPKKIPIDGYDMHRDLMPAWDLLGKYSTDVFTDEAVKIIEGHHVDDPLFIYLSHLAPHAGNPRDPFQAPDDVVAKFTHIEDIERRYYAAMVSKLDDSVGEVVAALKSKNMLDNSVIMFLSDNGGQTIGVHANRASNYPLRGMKTYAWEGGTRGLAAIWSPLLKKHQAVSNQLIHLVDWLPTLASLAGIPEDNFNDIDGLNVWNQLSDGSPSPRTEFIYNIDTVYYPYAAVRKNNWKYVEGTSIKEDNGWYGHTGRNVSVKYSTNEILHSRVGVSILGYHMKKAILKKTTQPLSFDGIPVTEANMTVRPLTEKTILQLREEAEVKCLEYEFSYDCNPLESPCLFDLSVDPCEKINLAPERKDVMNSMKVILDKYKRMEVHPRNQPGDIRVDPSLWNGVYSCWLDGLDKKKELNTLDFPLVLLIASCVALIGILAAIVVASIPRLFGSRNKVFNENSNTISNQNYIYDKYNYKY